MCRIESLWGDAMSSKRLRKLILPELNSAAFLWAMCLCFWAGLVIGLFLATHALSCASECTLDFTLPVSIRRFWSIFWTHIRWFAAVLLVALIPMGWLLIGPLVVVRGVYFVFGCVPFVGEAALPALLFRCGLVAGLECAPFLVFSAAITMLRYRALCRFDGAELLCRRCFLLLCAALALVFILICSYAELWLLPGFADHIQLFT